MFALLSKDNATAVSDWGWGGLYKCLTQSPYFKGCSKRKEIVFFENLDKDGVKITDDIT